MFGTGVVRPGGTFGNSPAIYRWVWNPRYPSGVPEGRLKGAPRDPFVRKLFVSLCLEHKTACIQQVDSTVTYIERQAEHHRQRSYQDECIAFLLKHQVNYDPRYLRD